MDYRLRLQEITSLITSSEDRLTRSQERIQRLEREKAKVEDRLRVLYLESDDAGQVLPFLRRLQAACEKLVRVSDERAERGLQWAVNVLWDAEECLPLGYGDQTLISSLALTDR